MQKQIVKLFQFRKITC